MLQFYSTHLLDTPRKLFRLKIAKKIFEKWHLPSIYLSDDKVG